MRTQKKEYIDNFTSPRALRTCFKTALISSEFVVYSPNIQRAARWTLTDLIKAKFSNSFCKERQYNLIKHF